MDKLLFSVLIVFGCFVFNSALVYVSKSSQLLLFHKTLTFPEKGDEGTRVIYNSNEIMVFLREYCVLGL